MKIFVVLLLLGAFLYQDISCRKTRHRRESTSTKIVGGEIATNGKFPYQVLLEVIKSEKSYRCGGSIISNQAILTAAHCLNGASKIYVTMGVISTSEDGETVVATTFTQHPDYNMENFDYDIGIITLDSPIQLDDKKTVVRLADEGTQIEPGQNVTVTGWGTTSEDGEASEILLSVNIPVVSNEECTKIYHTQFTAQMFCAGVPEGGKDACQGDSGGPAVLQSSKIQVGVVSFGIGCAREGYPGVYTSVPSVRDWIRQVSGV